MGSLDQRAATMETDYVQPFNTMYLARLATRLTATREYFEQVSTYHACKIISTVDLICMQSIILWFER